MKNTANLLPAAILLIAGAGWNIKAIAAPGPAFSIERGTEIPTEARAALERIVTMGAPGVTMVVARTDQEFSRVHVGAINSTTQYPIASASKWLTAAVMMKLVDEKKLALDAPVSRYLPRFKGEAGAITLRQILAQTTGTAGTLAELYDLKQSPRITLAQSTDEILARPFARKPGTHFNYGGPGFQIAGALAEAVTGQRWEEIFQSRIGRPLGMKSTYWQHLSFDPGPQVPPAETLNPVLQGGAVSTASDYMAFLAMLVQNGKYQGRRILSSKSVAAMHANQTLNAEMAPPEQRPVLPKAGYALGNWCEIWDLKARCTRVSSVGAFGTYPWIDLTSGLYGITFVKHDMFKVFPDVLAAQTAMMAAHSRLEGAKR